MKTDAPAAAAARVRMYRHGLGDCLLVTLAGPAGRPFHMLVDCGLLQGSPDEADAIARVARDVETASSGRLDVVVVSHDHWDKVSGFALARPIFDRIAIGEVWLPWTEDPGDPRARDLAARRERDLRGLRTLANRAARRDGRPEVAAELGVPLGFLGPRDGAAGRRAVEDLRDHPAAPRVRYLRGGAVVPLPAAAAAVARVLGPDQDEATGSAASSDAAAFLAALASGEDYSDVAGGDAFDDRYRIPPERAERLPFFRENYLAESEAWRRVDSDWTTFGVSLALRLDARCRDLGLALAIELEPGGAVLLFPGDAGTERWAAWARRRPGAGPGQPPSTTADLLARTVLFKLGRHGAAGAAPDADVLALMTRPDLVAMLAVDQEFAERAGWKMPDPALLDRVRQVARGRLLRSDRPFPARPEGVARGEWEAFRRATAFDPDGLYVDFHVPGPLPPAREPGDNGASRP